MTKARQRWLEPLKWILAVLAIYLALRKISVHGIWPVLLGANLGFFALSVGLQYMMNILNAFRWKTLLRDPDLRLGKYLYFVFMGFFFNLFLPSPALAEGVKVVAFGRKYGSLQSNIGITLLSRGMGFLTQLLIGALALIRYYPDLKKRGVRLHLPGTLWLWLLPLALLVGLAILFRLRRVLNRQVWISTMVEIGRDRGLILKTLLITILIQLLAAGSVYTMFLSVFPHADFWKITFFILIVQMVLLIPFSFGGIGVREYMVLLLFSDIGGMPPNAVFAVNLLGYIPMFLQAATGGLWMLFRKVKPFWKEKTAPA